ncbi:MAG: MucR family transcriptional regulator [Pseudomonadota bacterium]
MDNDAKPAEILSLTTQIVAAMVANQKVAPAELSGVIEQVFRTLSAIGGGPDLTAPAPAVPVKKSVRAEHVICLEDGKRLKLLKRHLKTAHNLTTEQYRQRWGLAADHPMVAPNYAAKRSQIARRLGLGTKGRRRRGPAS